MATSRKTRPHYWLWLLGTIVTVAIVVGVGYLAIAVVPDWWGAHTPKGALPLTAAEAADDRGRVRTAALAFLAGVTTAVGATATATVAALSFRLSRRGQSTERFTRAIELLGNRSMNARIGGIHALAQLAGDDPATHHRAVLEVLVSFVRDQSRWRPASGRRASPPPAALDVQAAMTVLARRQTSYDPEPLVIDLSQTNLRGIRAPGIRLRGADLSSAQLQEADLSGSDLNDADLVGAALDRTNLEDASLVNASFQGARLVATIFRGATGLSAEKLRGATYDFMATEFPDGFDPPDAPNIE